MALITFEDLPSTNTPINASNLNNNFNEINKYNSKRAYDTAIGDRGWFKILHINPVGTFGNVNIFFLISGTGFQGNQNVLAKINYYGDNLIKADILAGDINTKYIGYIKNADNSVDVYLYNDTVYKQLIIKPIDIYGAEWDIWNGNYPQIYSGTPTLTGNFKYCGNSLYSTDETICGTFVNGKPIYRIYLDLSASTSKADNSASRDISSRNIENIVNAYGVVNESNSQLLILGSDKQAITFNSNKTTLFVYFNNSTPQNYAGYIILEYTKTTD